jgi:hypothetical protein
MIVRQSGLIIGKEDEEIFAESGGELRRTSHRMPKWLKPTSFFGFIGTT